MSETLRERDLAKVRDECSDGPAAGKNPLELLIVPLTGRSLDDWPPGFADAVRKYGGLKSSAPIFPNGFHLLPFYSGQRTGQSTGRIKPSPVIVGTVNCDRLAFHRIKVQVDDSPFEFGVVLRTFSRGDGGDLLPGERKYVEFMFKAGSKLDSHGIVKDSDDVRAWLTFLVEYIWKHKRPKVSQGVATVRNLWKVSLAAIDRLPHRLENGDAAPELQRKRRGPTAKKLTEREQRLVEMYFKGWPTQFSTYCDLADAARDGWTATDAERLIRRVKKRRTRENGRQKG